MCQWRQTSHAHRHLKSDNHAHVLPVIMAWQTKRRYIYVYVISLGSFVALPLICLRARDRSRSGYSEQAAMKRKNATR